MVKMKERVTSYHKSELEVEVRENPSYQPNKDEQQEQLLQAVQYCMKVLIWQ